MRDDSVVAVHDIQADGVPIEQTDHRFNPETVRSINQLFALIRAARHGRLDSVSVTYDEQLGFPTELFADPLRAMTDEEITYFVSDVEPLHPEHD